VTQRRDPSLPSYLHTPLGEVVRAWRLERGLTLEDLAARVGSGMSRGYLSQLENDKIHTPSEEKLALLAAALSIDPLILVTRAFPTEAHQVHGRVDDSIHPLEDEAPGTVTADVSKLIDLLASLPPSRQQSYIDALIALIERLAPSEVQTER
jgi:transcriptional regulator with XRE-family HTH domain